MHVVTNTSGKPIGYKPSGALWVSGSPCVRISACPACRDIAPHAICIRRRAMRTWRACVLGEAIGAVAMARWDAEGVCVSKCAATADDYGDEIYKLMKLLFY
jgi:hypothetical protein